MRALSILALAALPAVAAAAGEPLQLTLVNQVPAGQKPSIKITAQQPVTRLTVTLTRLDDDAKFTLAAGPLKRGQVAALPFGDGKPGRARWKGALDATFADGSGWNSELTFETATTGEMRVTYARERLDLEARTVEIQMSRPAGRAEVKVFGEDGAQLGAGAATFAREAPGTWLRVGWTQTKPGSVFKIELRAVAADGIATLVKLVPWSIAIPHEEVNFESGKAVVRPSEEPKLDASYGKILEAVERARKADPSVAIRVFIAGHTDTVGKSDDNRRLSLERAKAIATWFRDRGLPVPLSYAGFGEEALKVKTADNVDEARNRRADYVVSIEEPVVARGVRAEWRPL
jgi:outer membrane protein OmpA-like peptidoglycan-associated protein